LSKYSFSLIHSPKIFSSDKFQEKIKIENLKKHLKLLIIKSFRINPGSTTGH